MVNEIDEFFITEVKKIFNFLVEHGFKLEEQMIEVTPLLFKLPFVGKHIAIILSFDCRENVVDCYVAKVNDGKINRDKSKGGYWTHLHAYLVKYQKFRGSIGDKTEGNDSLENKITKDLTDYANLLKEQGRILLTDDADVLPILGKTGIKS